MKEINETAQVNKDTQATITLGQLKTMVHSTAGKHLPTAKQFRENDERFMCQPLYDGWAELSGSEQDMLMELYGRQRLRNGAASRLSSNLNITERQVFRRSAQALQHFNEALQNHGLVQEKVR